MRFVEMEKETSIVAPSQAQLDERHRDMLKQLNERGVDGNSGMVVAMVPNTTGDTQTLEVMSSGTSKDVMVIVASLLTMLGKRAESEKAPKEVFATLSGMGALIAILAGVDPSQEAAPTIN